MGSLNDAFAIEAILKILIVWGPAIFAILALTIGFLIGFRRGMKKSLIMLIHAVACFSICFLLFFILVENRDFDKFLLDTVNKMIGVESGLEKLLGVSTECETIREVMIEYIPTQLSFMDGLELILKDNGAYLLTIVELIYRIILAIILDILYLILLLNVYVIYLIFYSRESIFNPIETVLEEQEEIIVIEEKKEKKVYKDNLIGGIIGFGRAFIRVSVILSLIGSLFFVVGNKTNKETIKDKSYSLITKSYSAICEYGSEGIFKVFNLLKDKENVPYYVYAVDLVFQGGLVEGKVDNNLILTNEFESYTSFTIETYNLLIKYGSDELKEIFNGNSEEDPMEVIIETLSNKDFQKEFDSIIVKFEKETYFMNFALSLCESIIAHIDDSKLLPNVPSGVREVLQICFLDGYLSPNIPYEAKLLEEKKNNPSEDESKYKLGCIALSNLITRRDVAELLSTFMDVISIYNEEDKTPSTLELTSKIINHIENLSIISTDRVGEINPVLRRLYTYLEITYLSNPLQSLTLDNTEWAPYSESKYNDVSWIDESKILINIIKQGLSINKDNFANISEDVNMMELVFGLFSAENPKYEDNINALNYLIDSLRNSRILGDVLSRAYGYDKMIASLCNSVNGFNMPTDINYVNTYSDTTIVEYGELYQTVLTMRKLVDKPEILPLISQLLENNNSATLLSLLHELSKKDEYETSILESVVESKIYRGILSKMLLDISTSQDTFVHIDSSILETDEMINKEDIKEFFDAIPVFYTSFNDLIDKNNEEDLDALYILNLLENPSVYKTLSSRIVEGTVSNLLFSKLPSCVVVPSGLKDGSRGLVSTKNEDSELIKLLTVSKDTSIDINLFLEDEMTSNELLDTIQSISDYDCNILFGSDILYYTLYNEVVSKELFTDFKVIIPNTVKLDLTNDVFDSIITKKEFRNLIKYLSLLITDEIINNDGDDSGISSFDFDSLLVNMVSNKDSLTRNDALVATLANLFANTSFNENFAELEIPASLINAAEIDKLTKNFSVSNPWFNEIYALINALDEILNISTNKTADFSKIDDEIEDSIIELNNFSNVSGKTKLDLLYDSSIIRIVLNKKIAETLVEPVFKEAEANLLKDDNGIYFKSEISSYVHLLSLFKLTSDDLVGNDLEIVLIENIAKNIDILNEQYDEGISQLQHLYKTKTFSMLLYQVIAKNFNIPESALMVDTNGVRCNGIIYDEAAKFLECLDIFGTIEGLSLETINFNELKDKRDKIAHSAIISSIIYNSIISSGNVLVPNSVLNEDYTNLDKYINSDELKNFINVITDLEVVDFLFDGTNEENVYDFTSIKFEAKKLKTDIIRKMSTSTILNATIVNQLEQNIDLSSLGLPTAYLNDSSLNGLQFKMNNIWITENELLNLVDTLDSLGIQISSIYNDPDEVLCVIEEFLDGLFDDDSLKETDENKVLSLFNSILIRSIVSINIDKNISYNFISDEAKYSLALRDSKHEELYKLEELIRIIKSFDSLNIRFKDFFSGKTTSDEFDVLEVNEQIYESVLVKAIVTNRINNSIKDGKYEISVHRLSYDADIYGSYHLNVFKWNEIEVMVNLMDENEEIHKDSLTFVKTEPMLFTSGDAGSTIYKSYILAASLTDNIIKYGAILSDDYDFEAELICPDSAYKLIQGLKALGIEKLMFSLNELPILSDDQSIKAVYDSGILNSLFLTYLSFEMTLANGELKHFDAKVLDGYYTLKSTYNGGKIAMLEYNEFVSLIKTISLISNASKFGSQYISFEQLDQLDDYGSNVFKVFLNDYEANLGIPTTKFTLGVCIKNGKVCEIPVFSSTDF